MTRSIENQLYSSDGEPLSRSAGLGDHPAGRLYPRTLAQVSPPYPAMCELDRPPEVLGEVPLVHTWKNARSTRPLCRLREGGDECWQNRRQARKKL